MKLVRGSTSDLISELPGNIIENILQFLPIQDALRTSLLSSKWRYKWVTLPSLTFDDRDIQFSSSYPALNMYKFLIFIDRVLMLHVGPIKKFKLYISDPENFTNIDQYILFLSKHSIIEFNLEVPVYSCKYVVPSCLFSCQQLSCLELHHCIFKCLSANKGFNSLKRLHLEGINFRGNDQFENLISCSPLLEILIVLNFENVSHVKIHAPNLKSLLLTGLFESICFVSTPHLASMSIALRSLYEDDNDKQGEQGLTSNLIEVLGDLHGIEKLCIENCFIDYLARENVPESLPTIYHHLKKLIVEMNFYSLDEISATLCLIRSAPNLEELEIRGAAELEKVEIDAYSEITPPSEGSVLNFLEKQSDLNFSFNQLRVVKLRTVVGWKSELELIRLILSSSPVLETMNIDYHTEDIDVAREFERRFLKELLKLRRTSARAEIVFLDGFED